MPDNSFDVVSQIEMPEVNNALQQAMKEITTRYDLKNSKTLIERDADFAKFAGRIQLTFIYEEVLGWDILRDGISRLKESHVRAFRKYIDHGIAIKRLTPRLREFDLGRLAGLVRAALDRAKPGDVIPIAHDYVEQPAYELLLDVREDGFDPASEDPQLV